MLNSNISLLRTEASSTIFVAVSTPAAGTRYSNLFPFAGTLPSGNGYGNGSIQVEGLVVGALMLDPTQCARGKGDHRGH
jgi:hypothetical protein